jgi:membrane-bound metal-dependent hydrolase YbcI (DUF457 family)
MIYFEHGMLGLTLAVAAGTHRRYGPALPITAALAAMLPDWDALAMLDSREAYLRIHRTWGHNLLLACGGGALVGAAGYLCYLSAGVRRRALAVWQRLGEKVAEAARPPTFDPVSLLVWAFVGAVAGLSHLATDPLYPWGVPPLWPFDDRRWYYPIFQWSERGPLVLFLLAMFALVTWRKHAQLIACATLLLFAAYIAVRSMGWWP